MPQMIDMRPKSTMPRRVMSKLPAAPSPSDGRMGSGRSAAQAYHRCPMSEFLVDTRDLLRRTPKVLRALLTGLPDTWTATPDAAEGWRPCGVGTVAT